MLVSFHILPVFILLPENHKVQFSDQPSCFCALVICWCRCSINFIHTHVLTTCRSMCFVIRLLLTHLSACVLMTFRSGWAQPSGAWAVQPGRLWRHYVDVQQGGCVDSKQCGTFDPIFKKKTYLFIYFLPSVTLWFQGWRKIMVGRRTVRIWKVLLSVKVVGLD